MMQDIFPPDSSSTFKNLNKKMSLTEIDHSTTNITHFLNAVSITRKVNFQLSRENPNNYLVQECPKTYNLGYVTPRKSVFLNRINSVLLDIHCFGFFQKWLDIYFFKITLQNAIVFKWNSAENVKVLAIEDLGLSFFILGVGTILSLIVFIFEVMFKRTRLNKGKF